MLGPGRIQTLTCCHFHRDRPDHLPIDEPVDEVETHVLLVNLSEIAKKFLEVEEFFKTGEPFQDEPDYPLCLS
jgi:hypothetical protein